MSNWTKEEFEAHMAKLTVPERVAFADRFNSLTPAEARAAVDRSHGVAHEFNPLNGIPIGGPIVSAKPRATGRMPMPKAMNKTEQAYARHLERQRLGGDVLWWGFEVIKVRIGHDCWLTPDFLVMYANGSLVLIDTKGTTKNRGKQPKQTYYAEEDALVKARSVGANFPIPIRFTWMTQRGDWDSREM